VGKTRHIQARMSQRAINQKLVELALEFGVEAQNGKVILNRQGLVVLLEQLKQLHQTAQKAIQKGGLVVVHEGEVLITTYRLDSFQRGTPPTCTSENKDKDAA
jgi:hypothetical protein